MTQEDIIRMAREAGFTDHNGFCEVIVRHSNGSWIGIKDEIERFAAFVAAAEREACARVCEDGVQNATDWDSSYWDQACQNRAAAIRARGQQ